jgi:hypothetical protein
MQQPIVLDQIHQDIINNQSQCLAQVGKGKSQRFCEINVKLIRGLLPLCFCSQQHAHLDEGLSRDEMYRKLYLLKQVGDEVTELEGLVSNESFALHKKLCDQICPQIKRYKLLVAKFGDDHASVRRLKSVHDDMMKYIRMWRKLNKSRDIFLEELGMNSYAQAFSSPLQSPYSSGVSTPNGQAFAQSAPARSIPPSAPQNSGASTPNRAKRTSTTDVGSLAPQAKRVASVPPSPAPVSYDAAMDGVFDPSFIASSSADPEVYHRVESPMNMGVLGAALDEDERKEEAGAQNIDPNEPASDDEESTDEDRDFISADEDFS